MEQLLTVWYKLQQIVDGHRIVDEPNKVLDEDSAKGCVSYAEYFHPDEIETLSSIADSLREMLAQKLA